MMDTQLFLPGSAAAAEQAARNRAEVEQAHAAALDEQARRRKTAEDARNRAAKLARMGPQSRAVEQAKRFESRIEQLTKAEIARQRVGTAHDVGQPKPHGWGVVRASVVRAHARMLCSACRQSVQHHVGEFTVEHGTSGRTVYAPVVCPECAHKGEMIINIRD